MTGEVINRPFATSDHVVQNRPCWRASSLLFPYWDIKTKRPEPMKLDLPLKKTVFYLEGGLLHEIGLIYITNKLHHRKCFVRILFTRCKTLETHSFTMLTRSFLKFCDS